MPISVNIDVDIDFNNHRFRRNYVAVNEFGANEYHASTQRIIEM